jgi:hypothetical protein
METDMIHELKNHRDGSIISSHEICGRMCCLHMSPDRHPRDSGDPEPAPGSNTERLVFRHIQMIQHQAEENCGMPLTLTGCARSPSSSRRRLGSIPAWAPAFAGVTRFCCDL